MRWKSKLRSSIGRTVVRCGVACLLIAVSGCRPQREDTRVMCEASLPDPSVTAAPAVWRMRRLTRHELERTFAVLVGVVPPSLSQLPQEDGDVSAGAPAPSGFEVDLYRQIAIEAADAGSTALVAQWACSLNPGCLQATVPRWIERVYRAPLDPDERSAYAALFAGGNDPRTMLRGLLEVVFQSPRFLYVIESGIARDDREDTRELTATELATRLSYFLWSEPPDDALWQAARAGSLAEPAALAAQARRLIRDPRAARTLGHALQKWAAPELDIVAKADTVYPEFDPALRTSMIEQFDRFAAMAIAEEQTFRDLVTTSRAPIDARLADLLGIDAGRLQPSAWKTVDLKEPRFGVLTLPGVLTANARADDSSPVQRGLFIRQNLLCQTMPPPPKGVPPLPPATSSGTSFRDRFEAHTSNPVCATCHQLMDPLGFPFEIYDGLGRLRPDFAGISTAGKLAGVSAPGEFADLGGLVDLLLASPEAPQCWAQQWMQRALGPDQARDDALLAELSQAVSDGTSLSELIVRIVTSPAFSRVQRPAAE
jgi:hypothetical protein